MPRAAVINLKIDVTMGAYKHQFVYPWSLVRATEFQWFALLKTIKDAMNEYHRDRRDDELDAELRGDVMDAQTDQFRLPDGS